MNHQRGKIRVVLQWLAVLCLFGSSTGWVSGVSADPPKESQWEKTIAAFEEADRKQPPPKQGALFVGSSSIRMWNLKESFPDLPVINRGFGGSHIADSVQFAERIVIPHEPRVVVFYAGDNDLNSGKTVERVEADFREFVGKVHAKLPKTRIVFLAIKPSPSRWKLFDKQTQANERIQKFCESDKRLTYLDVVKPMLGDDGQPRAELFSKDQLHMNADGYRLWTELVKPHITAGLKPAS